MSNKDFATEFYLLAGYAGTGKTTVAENILVFASECGVNAFVLAPTNKAASVLRSKLDGVAATFEVKTLHSALYGQPDEDGNWVAANMLPKGLVLVDESSMITEDVLNDLFTLLTQGSLVVFMGDGFQLEPVGTDPHLFQWLRNGFKRDNKIELTEVRRQSEGSAILKVATCMRVLGNPVIPATSYDDFKVVYDGTQFRTLFLDSLANGEDCVCIVSTNKTRINFNEQARKRLYGYEKTPIEDKETLISVSNSSLFSNSDLFKVEGKGVVEHIFKLAIDFGTRYKTDIKSVTLVRARIQVEGVSEPVYVLLAPELDKPTLPHQTFDRILNNARKEKTLQQLNMGDAISGPTIFDHIPMSMVDEADSGKLSLSRNVVICTYGYSITAHKSQGSQWDKVFVNLDWYMDGKSPARWVYTAITRAAQEVNVLSTRYFKSMPNEELDRLFEEQN